MTRDSAIAAYIEGASITAIAAACGKSVSVVHKWLVDSGTPRRARTDRGITAQDRREWRDLWSYGFGSSYIAKLYGRHHTTVLREARAR